MVNAKVTVYYRSDSSCVQICTSYIQIDDEIIRQCETLRKKKKIRFITINFRLVKFINM